jgi:hypothetical protein
MLYQQANQENRMIEHRIENEIHIHCPQDEVFAYVSQPWFWHEWHPASESATCKEAELGQGVAFEEVVSMAPVSFVPLRIRRLMRWTVLGADAPHRLEMRGSSKTIDVRVVYDLLPFTGTRFRRTFHYQVKGPLRHIERWLVLPKMKRQSAVALQRLKRNLEFGKEGVQA